MNTTPIHRIAVTTVCVALAAATTACGSDDDHATPATEAAGATPAPTTATTNAPETTPPTSTSTTTTTTATPTSTIAAVDETWREAAVGSCERLTAAMFAIADPTGTGDFARYVEDHVLARDELVGSAADLDLPPALTEGATACQLSSAPPTDG